jgi:hypothetical protein
MLGWTTGMGRDGGLLLEGVIVEDLSRGIIVIVYKIDNI